MARIKAKTWSVEQKVSLVMRLISKEASAEELAKSYGIGQSTIYKWRDSFLQKGKEGLAQKQIANAQVQELKAENQHLKEALADAVVKLEMQKNGSNYELS
jgi:transposase-like protein